MIGSLVLSREEAWSRVSVAVVNQSDLYETLSQFHKSIESSEMKILYTHADQISKREQETKKQLQQQEQRRIAKEEDMLSDIRRDLFVKEQKLKSMK
jgi:adenylate kinase